MNIFFNDQITKLPEPAMSIADIAKWKNLPAQGTAVALNDKLVKRELWTVTFPKENDRITVITAAFGG
ncbi:MAG: sulfur carrier protein ThiS [Muribaculaceae bacterium]|nr:sulfur carrier protein ThiS [Muribaculaceae bacterium]